MAKYGILETLYDKDDKIIGVLCKRISSKTKDEDFTSTREFNLFSSNAKKNKNGLIFEPRTNVGPHHNEILDAMCEYAAKYNAPVYANTSEEGGGYEYVARPAATIEEIRQNAIQERKLNMQRKQQQKLSSRLKATPIGKKIATYLKKVKAKKNAKTKAEYDFKQAQISAIVAQNPFEIDQEHSICYNKMKELATSPTPPLYAKCTIDEAIQWAAFMKHEMGDDNKLTSQIIEKTCYDLGLDRPAFPAEFLITCWKHGKEFGEIYWQDKEMVRKFRNNTSNKNIAAKENMQTPILVAQQKIH